MNARNAIHAYKSASRFRSQRDQEAAVIGQVIVTLKGAKDAPAVQQVRALADNRRLWITLIDLMRDPGNALPEPLRASMVSVGLTMQREMDQEKPDFDFLISVNENIAAGLQGQP